MEIQHQFDCPSTFDQFEEMDESEPLRVNQNITNIPTPKLNMASPTDHFIKNVSKQNFIDTQGTKSNEEEMSECYQNENDSHKSNSRKKNKRNFTTMVADTTLPHSDDSPSKMDQENLNSSSNKDMNHSNSKIDYVTYQSK